MVIGDLVEFVGFDEQIGLLDKDKSPEIGELGIITKYNDTSFHEYEYYVYFQELMREILIASNEIRYPKE